MHKDDSMTQTKEIQLEQILQSIDSVVSDEATNCMVSRLKSTADGLILIPFMSPCPPVFRAQ